MVFFLKKSIILNINGYRLITFHLSIIVRSLPAESLRDAGERKEEKARGKEFPKRSATHARAPRCRQRNTPLFFYLFFLSYSPSRICPRSVRRRAVVPSAISSQINQTFESRSSLLRPPRSLRATLSPWYRHKTL